MSPFNLNKKILPRTGRPKFNGVEFKNLFTKICANSRIQIFYLADDSYAFQRAELIGTGTNTLNENELTTEEYMFYLKCRKFFG